VLILLFVVCVFAVCEVARQAVVDGAKNRCGFIYNFAIYCNKFVAVWLEYIIKSKYRHGRGCSHMIKNKKFALSFRLVAMLFTLYALMRQFGVFLPQFYLEAITYYTIQSNALAFVMLAMLAVCTERDMGTTGNSGYFTRFRMICTVNLLLTFVIFWVMLAPNLPFWYLMSFNNLSIHAIVPLLCLSDYVLFSQTGRLKYKDVYLTLTFPLTYIAFTSVAGFSGYDYGLRHIATARLTADAVSGYFEPVRFPYFFLDFDVLGLWAFAYIVGIAALIVMLGHFFYYIDRKLFGKNPQSEIRHLSPTKCNVPVITLISLTIAVMLLVAAGLGTRHVSRMDEYSKAKWREYENVILRIGRYMHESGDPSKYITVYDDKTIQVFGFDYYEFIINDAEFLNELAEQPTDEWRESLIGTVLERNEQYKQRGEYGDELSEIFDNNGNILQEGMFSMEVNIGEGNLSWCPIFQYVDDGAIGFFDGLYEYRGVYIVG